ncbi:MAG: sulfurtransferase TusA family protein [Candidatus Melainabacteria bacterium]|nr:sulfurtransferase TusA family protein [Candidatus Melainabacteria bacterium]
MENIIKSNFFLDLRGIACPLNFVKTKIQLEKMEEGEVLEVLLDPGEAIESVPPSVIEEGYTILSQIPAGNYFKIFIRK